MKQSETVSIKLPRALHEAAKQEAIRRGSFLQRFVTDAVKRYLEDCQAASDQKGPQ